MSRSDPAQDLALLETSARQAGAIALRFWRQDPQAWDKAGDAGPVSEADLAVDTALKQTLLQARPDYGWLSEESPDDPARLAHDRVFIVDPIDGTRSFLAGDDGFAVSLAVAEAGRIIAALVHLPARQTTYAAHINGPALRNGSPISPSIRQALEGADILTTRAHLAAEHWPNGLPDVQRSFRPALAWRFCLVAEGRHDAMVTLRPTWEWDSAAGTLIAQRAGCIVTNRQGEGLVFNKPHPQDNGIIAAPPALHAGFMAALTPR